MKKSAIGFALLFLFLIPAKPASGTEAHPVFLLEVTGTIDPAQARYVTRGLEEAREEQAAAVLIRLDTPGGLDGSMRKIMQAILDSPVPVIVYVAPAGARAASAGAFLTMAAHIAAMAPGTNIGAAHPVQLGAATESSGKKGEPSVMEAKLTNDAAAYIRAIAELRGRNAEWAQAAVRESRSSPAEEALRGKIIDLIAENKEDLLNQVEGREVKTVFGAATLKLKGQPQRALPMSILEKGLHQLAHPSLAYILLLLGIYGLIYELATPGALFPGVLGAILLVLGLVALETLDVNWGGIALIGLSVLFFIADIKLPGYGALTLGGIIAFILGSMILFPGTRVPVLKLPWGVIGAAAAATAGFFLGVVGVAIRALKRKVAMGVETLIGAVGVAKTDVKPEGIVHVHGEEWQARSASQVQKGARVKITKVEGLTVHVELVKEEGR